MIDPEKPTELPAEFHGRRGVVRRVTSRVGAERPQSVAVIGGRRSGKTSLLNYPAHPDTARELLADPAFALLRIDARSPGVADSRGFLAALSAALERPGFERGNGGYDAVRRAVESAHEAGRRLVLLLDDFHLVTGNAAFPLEFFSFLRSLANNYNLAYVTTSFLELQRLCVAKDVEESPFFNIFTNVSLGPLAPEEAEQLLASLLGTDRPAVAAAAAWCGGVPYALKLAARRLAEMPRGEWTEAGLEKKVLPDLQGYYDEVVSILPRDAAKPLKALARGKQPSPQEAHLVRPLVRQGFLVEDGETRSFAPSFSVYLARALDPARLKGRA